MIIHLSSPCWQTVFHFYSSYTISCCLSVSFPKERWHIRHSNFNKVRFPLTFHPFWPLSLDGSWRLIQNLDLRHQIALSLSSMTTTVWPSVEHCLIPMDHLHPAMKPCSLKPTRSESKSWGVWWQSYNSFILCTYNNTCYSFHTLSNDPSKKNCFARWQIQRSTIFLQNH